MWIEQKKDLIVICQGMGKNAFIFYHRFWGIVAKCDTNTPEEAQKENKVKVKMTLSIQATRSQIESIIKHYWGNVWGKYEFEAKYINNDDIEVNAKITLKKRG